MYSMEITKKGIIDYYIFDGKHHPFGAMKLDADESRYLETLEEDQTEEWDSMRFPLY